jgi:hypothetical protein
VHADIAVLQPVLGCPLVSANSRHAASVVSLARAVGHALYSALRGGGALIEGIEFWGTHAQLAVRRIADFLVATACTVIVTRVVAGIEGYLPSASALPLPWYLVAVEWAWSQVPSGLAAALTAWGVETAYLSLVSMREVVDTVVSRRGGASDRSASVSSRKASLVWLLIGGFGCIGLAYVPVIGAPLALAIMCPVLGTGVVAGVLASRGWTRPEIFGFVRSRAAMLSGLGAGVFVGSVIPVVNLVALPCAAAGTVCLVLREERAAPVRTSEGKVPCASPGK